MSLPSRPRWNTRHDRARTRHGQRLGGGVVTAQAPLRGARGPLPAWLHNLKRLADLNGWDSLSYRQIGAGDGYLFTRGLVEVDVRASRKGRITHAIRTCPGDPAIAPDAGRGNAVKAWLTEPSLTTDHRVRFTRVRRTVAGSIKLVTHDSCRRCGGPITNNPLTQTAADLTSWVHLHHRDWTDNTHPAEPIGGSVTADDQPAPWRIAGVPQ